jgi:hypothetical protein
MIYKLLQKKQYKYDEGKIRNELSRMRSQMTMLAVRSLYHLLHKIGNHVCAGMYVDLKALEKVKIMCSES